LKIAGLARPAAACRPDREGTISGKIAKDLFEIVWNEGGDPRELVESRG
jgi:hypothetical protein